MKYLILIICTVFGFCPGMASSSKNISLNWKLGSSGKAMHIQIPEEFKKASEQSNSVELLIEFIPKEENLKSWTQIITIQRYSSLVPVRWILDATKESMEKNAGDLAKKTQMSFTELEGISTGYLQMEVPAAKVITQEKMSPIEEYNELIATRAFRGPKNIWLVQYSMRYPKEISEAQIEQMEKKAKDFLFENCLIKYS